MKLLQMLPLVSAALLVGCKIVIPPMEGGSVASTSGAYDCAENHQCVIDVYDVFFDESFTAIPSPGYEFITWRRAPKRFCGGSTEACRLKTTAFPGNDALLDILESDKEFFLEPIFRKVYPGEYRITYRASDAPRVIDSNGRVIGSFIRINEYGTSWDIKINFEGLKDPYVLTILEVAHAPVPQDFYRADIGYSGGDCSDQHKPMALLEAYNEFDPYRVYMRGSERIYIPTPNGRPSELDFRMRWSAYGLGCEAYADFRNPVLSYPLSNTNLEIYFPLKVEGTEIIINQHLDLVI